MTLEEFYKATEGMPKDAEMEFYHYKIGYGGVYNAYYNEELNKIELC